MTPLLVLALALGAVLIPLGASRGTRDCMRQARLAGIPVTDYGQATP